MVFIISAQLLQKIRCLKAEKVVGIKYSSQRVKRMTVRISKDY